MRPQVFSAKARLHVIHFRQELLGENILEPHEYSTALAMYNPYLAISITCRG